MKATAIATDAPCGTARAETKDSIAPSTLVRWCKFNLVGGLGIGVQFAILFLLKSVMHFNYLAATAAAVEAAVVHNFLWHEQFTWADRMTRPWRVLCTSGAEAPNFLGAVIAALKRCATPKKRCASPKQRSAGAKLCKARLRRLLRFHLGNGAVSILGNLGLMKAMAGFGHMNYLLANAIAIAVCSLGNFLVSEQWVFEDDTR